MTTLPQARMLRWISRAPRQNNVLPGLGMSLGITITFLAILVMLPLSALVLKSLGNGLDGFWKTITAERVLIACKLSLTTSLVAAIINTIFGTIVAWALCRYNFFGRRFLDAIIDLPFALPTAVTGLVLTAIYAPNGWLGKPLAALGIKVAFTPLGLIVALVVIGLPFVVRSVQPALAEIDAELEEAAHCLGANQWQTIVRVVLPGLVPAILSGFTLAFARGLGEYGSAVFIAGNMPMKSEIAPVLMVAKLEQYDYAGAAAIAVAMLMLALMLLFLANIFQRWATKRSGGI